MNLYGRLYRSLLLPVFDGLIKRRNTIHYWQKAERTQWNSRQNLEEQQLRDLRSLLGYAMAQCDFYREQWDMLKLNPDSILSLTDFQCWPLLTREVIRENRMRMQSRSIVHRITKSTGGSSGEPLVFDIDNQSNDRRTAIMYRGYGWAGCGPGTRRVLIWGTDLRRSSFWKSLKVSLHHRFDQQRMMDCFDFCESKMHNHFEQMERYRPESIVAYTNPLVEFCKFLKANSLQPTGVRSIVVGAEKVYPFQRELIETVFQAPVFETYGSREFMLIGSECELHCGLHLSMENLLVEILDDHGRPTPDGDEGNVVITDLFNRGMPFIRYINGDRAIAGFSQCNCGRGLPLLRSVVGRQLDVLTTPTGSVIAGELFPHLFKDFGSVRRFQVHQYQTDEIQIKMVGDDQLTDETCRTIRDKIVQTLGSQMQVRLEVVSEIPLSRAGKHQVVINHLRRKQCSV